MPSKLPPLLIQLTLDGADDATLESEGFTVWEVRAARAIVSRATQHSLSPDGLSPDAPPTVLTADP